MPKDKEPEATKVKKPIPWPTIKRWYGWIAQVLIPVAFLLTVGYLWGVHVEAGKSQRALEVSVKTGRILINDKPYNLTDGVGKVDMRFANPDYTTEK